eukprot:CAMPEP_0182545702 /NCGR_PEP_ID=MMETSP1323-20130603/34909_1 /TAXON_ID=236787 /ORGANISM="Florenciella parvula, Strain RCC1693" /LENGTH=58 /DNA_ID=CAMNT_0024756867 /DNA_START=369 /DNA_END=545 /DNA_ORIENTATION=+
MPEVIRFTKMLDEIIIPRKRVELTSPTTTSVIGPTPKENKNMINPSNKTPYSAGHASA